MAGRLQGKVALVTGGGAGLGEAIVRRFQGEGARVLVNDLHPRSAERVASAVGGRALVADVSDSAAVRKMFADVAAREGRLDVLVNNAGIGGHEGNPKMAEDFVRVGLAGETARRHEVEVGLAGEGRDAVLPALGGLASSIGSRTSGWGRERSGRPCPHAWSRPAFLLPPERLSRTRSGRRDLSPRLEPATRRSAACGGELSAAGTMRGADGSPIPRSSSASRRTLAPCIVPP